MKGLICEANIGPETPATERQTAKLFVAEQPSERRPRGLRESGQEASKIPRKREQLKGLICEANIGPETPATERKTKNKKQNVPFVSQARNQKSGAY